MTLNQVSKWISLKELHWINIFQFKNDWIKCIEYVNDVLPEIISSNSILRKTFKRRRNNFKKKHKNRNYTNFMEKEKYDTSYANVFINNYNSQDNLIINLAKLNIATIISKKKWWPGY